MKRKYFYLIIFFLSLTIQKKAIAQYNLFSNFGESVFVDMKTHIGKPIVYSDSLNQSLQNPFMAIDLRFAINSFGRTPQDKFLKFPAYGLGVTHYRLHSDTIGNPIGIYAFFASPFLINSTNLQLGWEIASGTSFNFNEFDIINNPKNDLIGSKINVYFDLSLWAGVKINERLDILLTSNFTHFSNGTINTPNKGLNLLGGNMGLRYHFQFEEKGKQNFERKTQTDKSFEPLKPYNEFSVWYGIGGKAPLNVNYDGPVYFCSTVSADFNHRYSWIGKFGLGADLFYDGSLTTDFPMEKDIPRSRFMFLGIHGNHEFMVANFSLAIQVGLYTWKGMNAKGNFYIRTGIKYDFTEHFFINLSLKSVNGLKADYIELGLGYRWGNWEKK